MRHFLRAAGAAVALALPWTAPLDAQRARPERGRFEVPGLDFRPDGAWRTRAATVRAARRQLLRAGDLAALNAPRRAGAPAVTGAYYVPVVPIAFSNVPAPAFAGEGALHDKLFHDRAGDAYSLRTFYEQMSDGAVTLTGTVFPWVVAPHPDTYYENGCNGVLCGDVSRFGELLVYGLDRVSNGPDSATVWAGFDNDGPDGVPNSGDDDGFVDFVTFLQPEIDGACGTSNVWAHRWRLSALNLGSPYTTKTPWAGHAGQFIKVEDYTMQSAQGGAGSCDPGEIMPIGTVAHETGHAFGLPDLYDTGGGSEGIGEWGLMGSGNYARAYSPSRMEAWSLFELGWVQVDTLRASGTITLGPVQTSDTVLVAPIEGTDEFLLIENRAALESDTAMFNPTWTYENGQPRWKQPGLLVWHVDQSLIDTRRFQNAINTGPIHGVALVQADGRNDLRSPRGGNRGDAGDAFPGSSANRRLAFGGAPAPMDNQNVFAGFSLDSIHVDASGSHAVAFRFRRLRLTTSVAGSGSVTTDLPATVDPARGVPDGLMVGLSALPAPGFAFAGWAGDTTDAQSPTLRLAMDRDYAIVAQFVPAGEFVTLEQAAAAILGKGTATPLQLFYLDESGNRSGSYDVGDFLALVDRNGQTPPPAVMDEIMRKAAAKGLLAPAREETR